MKKGAKGIISAPFKAVDGVASAVGAANNALEDIDQRRNMKKMEKAGLFDDNVLYKKYQADSKKGDQSYKDWKANYVKSQNKSGYDYSKRLETTYERMVANGEIKPDKNGNLPDFDDWKREYMGKDFKARWSIQKNYEQAERAQAKETSRERHNREKNQQKILKYTGKNQWEDTVANRAEAEAKAGKKIRWKGEAIDSEEEKRKREQISDASAYNAKKLANIDPKNATNEVRQISLLQQILNSINGLNPDGSERKHRKGKPYKYGEG